MWQMIVTSLLCVVLIEGNTMEGPLWIQDEKPDLFLRRSMDVRSQRSFQQNTYNPEPDYDLFPPQFPQNKRAITMFSRWSPLGNIGKQRNPIRSNSNTLPSHPRDRQHGQPLRWG